MKNLKNMMIAVVAVVALGSSSAHAGGIIGDLIEAGCGNCGVGKALDKVNANAGNPVDHAVYEVVDAYVPGAGVVLEANLAYQQQMVEAQRQREAQERYYQQYNNDYYQQPVYQGQPDYYGGRF